MTHQLDILRDDPKRLAESHREAARTELINPYYPMKQRQERHDYYMALAEQMEQRA